MRPHKQIRLGPDRPYDVIVCGAGHAGVEAALAAARMGVDVLLLTGNVDTIAQMSCNPAIGGQAKGHIVREIDALGGEMGLTADVTGIQFRLLNSSKGPAVQAPRAQCDKKAYQFRMKVLLERQPHLDVKQANVTNLITGDNGASLPPSYTLFGQVTAGLDTAVAAMAALFNPDPAANGVPPAADIILNSVTISEA